MNPHGAMALPVFGTGALPVRLRLPRSGAESNRRQEICSLPPRRSDTRPTEGAGFEPARPVKADLGLASRWHATRPPFHDPGEIRTLNLCVLSAAPLPIGLQGRMPRQGFEPRSSCPSSKRLYQVGLSRPCAEQDSNLHVSRLERGASTGLGYRRACRGWDSNPHARRHTVLQTGPTNRIRLPYGGVNTMTRNFVGRTIGCGAWSPSLRPGAVRAQDYAATGSGTGSASTDAPHRGHSVNRSSRSSAVPQVRQFGGVICVST